MSQPTAQLLASDTADSLRESSGSMLFLGPDETREKIAAWRDAGIFVVRVGVSANARGHVEDVVDDAVDAALSAHGAAAPGVNSALDRDAAFSDRIFRARRIGFYGIAVVIESLRSTTAGHLALDAGDCATLRSLADLTRDRPLSLVFDRGDRDLGAHGRPIPFVAIFAPNSSPARPAPSLTKREPISMVVPAPTRVIEKTVPVHETRTAEEAQHAHQIAQTIGVSVATPEDVWRGWMLALTAAKGAQSLATFERLFVDAYLPLLTVLAAGLDDPRAKASMLVFRRTFESSYPEAAARFQMTAKRPSMTLDVPQNAMRLARAHGARASQIVLVEAMRYDIGVHVRDEILQSLGDRATLVDDARLHAALPTTSARQLETIARGVEALRSPSAANDDATLATPGGGLRKIRVGGRELYRLDTIDVALQNDGTATALRLFDLAREVAETIACHASLIKARTLLYVVGDRGFSIDAGGRAKCGGSTPEEVIVPAFAFLIEA
ncbi:MAG: hypothetical protein ABI461_15380 [Polyangiaceae bacterium]